MCGAIALIPIYRPPTTQRDLTVHICSQCGLVQSWPRIDHVVERGNPNPTIDADFGNLRYGKQFSINTVSNICEWLSERWEPGVGGAYLDIGGGRGDVASRVQYCLEPSEITIIEPDERFKPDPIPLSFNWISKRVEEVPLESDRYDFVTCIHTLEHLADPLAVLRQIHRAMNTDGIIYVEVPYLNYISENPGIAEYFIDKHLTHFTNCSLEAMMYRAGFVYLAEWSTDANIGNTYRKGICPSKETSVAPAFKMISKYCDRRKILQALVEENVAILNSRMENGLRVVFWGAGRIFDAYVRAGLNVKALKGIIDLYIPESRFDLIKDTNDIPYCDLVVIASDEYEQEIKKQFTDAYRCENRPYVKSWKEKL